MKYLTLSIPGFGNINSGLPEGVPKGGLFGTGENVIGVAIELVLVGGVLLSLFYIIRGGVNIITSGGHKEKLQLGRERVRYAIIGLVIIFMSFFMVNIIGTIFGVPLIGQNKKPSFECGNTSEPCCPGNVCYGKNVCGRTDQTCEIR